MVCLAYGDDYRYDTAPSMSRVLEFVRRSECLEQAIEELRQLDNGQVQSILEKTLSNLSSLVAEDAQDSSTATPGEPDSVASRLAAKTASKAPSYICPMPEGRIADQRYRQTTIRQPRRWTIHLKCYFDSCRQRKLDIAP
jgi:hypothetical protein